MRTLDWREVETKRQHDESVWEDDSHTQEWENEKGEIALDLFGEEE